MPGDATIPAMRRISAYSSSVSGQIVRRVFFINLIFRSRRFCAHLHQGHLPRQALDRAQVHHKFLFVQVVRIGVRIAAHFRQRVHGMLRLPVIAKRAVALVNLLELSERVRLVSGVPPHLFAFHEEGVPVIDARVNGQEPSTRFGGRLRHPQKSYRAHYTRSRAKCTEI